MVLPLRDPEFIRQFHSNCDDHFVMQKQLLGPWGLQEGATGWDALHNSCGKDSEMLFSYSNSHYYSL